MVGSFLPPPSTVRELPDALILAGIGLILVASSPRLGAAFVSINLLLVFHRQLPFGLFVVLALSYAAFAMLLMFMLGMIALMLLAIASNQASREAAG